MPARPDWTIDVTTPQDIAADVAAIGRLETVGVALKVLRRSTGLRIAVVARVTDQSWTACAVLDEAGFGLLPGDELDVRTTFCSVVQGTVAPLLINHASTDPRFTEHPAPRLYGIESYIAVPLNRRDGSYFGALCALDPQPAALTTESFAMFDLMASLIAFELEAEDTERSARATAERLAQQAQELARLEERERIAMDLHDGVIQSLYAVVLNLGAHQLDGPGGPSDRGVEHAIERISAVISDIRANILELRPRDQKTQSLAAALTLLVAEMRGSTPLTPTLDVAADADQMLAHDVVRNLLHVVREAISNVVRHARATTIAVRVACVDGWLALSIEDNGRGFELPERGAQGGNGLRNIHERARLSGGVARIASQPGGGTSVTVRVPAAADGRP